MYNQLQSPLQRQIERVRHTRRLVAAEDDLLPSTRVGIKRMQVSTSSIGAAGNSMKYNFHHFQKEVKITARSTLVVLGTCETSVCTWS
jgi:hypothetical protein